MKRICLVLLLALVCAGAGLAQTKPAQTQATPAAPKTHLKVGDAAPDFTLTDTGGKPVKLSEFKGKKNVVLAFYVLAFTGG
jgi:cytochrome oxidase Cu insertion factor (SCO1/SenC/PrrC family)